MYLNHYFNTKRIATYTHNLNLSKIVTRYFEEQSITHFSKIDTSLINKFILSLKKKGNSNDTINKYINFVRRVCKYIEKQELIDHVNIDVELKRVELPKIEIIEAKELQRILEYSKTLSKKSRLILLLLISTGIRRTELTLIKIKNIDFYFKQIFLEHTKTGKPRYIFFEGNPEIENLIIYFSKLNKTYLFEDSNEQPITANCVSQVIKRIKKNLMIDYPLSPHKFRHTYATMLIQNGADIEQVRRLMGHQSYQMTTRYLHL